MLSLQVLLVLLALSGHALSLTCYSTPGCADGELCATEECGPEDDACRILYTVDSRGTAKVLFAACSQAHEDCMAAQCVATVFTGLASCCCDHDYCNVLPGLTEPAHTPLLPPSPSGTPPPDNNQEGMVVCEVYNCSSPSAVDCFHGYEICRHCTASYMADERENFELHSLGCSQDTPPPDVTERCELHTSSPEPALAECVCNSSKCNSIRNLVFSDPNHAVHFIDSECPAIGCSHSCVRLTNGSRICLCQTGFALGPDGATCVDVDECAVGLDDCAEICHNTVGGFTCSCREGRVLTPSHTCFDPTLRCANHSDCNDSSCLVGCLLGLRDFVCFSAYYVDTNDVEPFSHSASTPCIEPEVLRMDCGTDECVLQKSQINYWICCCTVDGCNTRSHTVFPNLTLLTTTPPLTTSADTTLPASGALSQAEQGVIGALVVLVFSVVLIVSVIIIICVYRYKKAKPDDQDDFLELEAEPCHTGMDLNTIETSVRVGGGRYTQVFQGHSSVHNRELAVKEFSPSGKDSYQREKALYLLTDFGHPNILKFVGCRDAPAMWVVTEYHQLGSLQAVLKREDPLSEEQAFSLGYNFIKGLTYLHHEFKPCIVHRDVKSSNILVTSWGPAPNCVISDFGLAITLPTEDAVGQVGTPRYMAPEVLDCYTEHGPMTAVDVYSAGLTLWEIVNRTQPSPDHPVPPYTQPFDEYFSTRHHQPSIDQMVDLFKQNRHTRPTIPPYYVSLRHGSTSGRLNFIADCIERAWEEQPQCRVTATYVKLKFEEKLPQSNGNISAVNVTTNNEINGITYKAEELSTTV